MLFINKRDQINWDQIIIWFIVAGDFSQNYITNICMIRKAVYTFLPRKDIFAV